MRNRFEVFSAIKTGNSVSCNRLIYGALIFVAVVGLTACGSKEKNSGQSLVRVNGEEITMLQLNQELQRANVPPEQQKAAQQQILESLINRQLLIAEATRNKIDRSPDVMQAIERAKAQIIAQAYLKGITAKVVKPSMSEIDDYYQKHPELFAENKHYNMKSLAVSDNDKSDELKAVMGSAKSLEEVETWLKNHGVQYMRGQASRSSTDLPPEMVSKLQAMPQGKMFTLNEGGKIMLVELADVKVTPISQKDAEPLIAQYLFNKKAKEIADTEVTSLRSLAKIEYLNASAPVASTEGKPASNVLAVPETKAADTGAGGH
jgi:EpsD family peptidyl-prolyl cis-trans isomerase